MATRDIPLIVIIGPTASGKSSIGMQIAKTYGGEIVCADSRTVYKDLNIATAKPSPADQAVVPHHGLDIVTLGERFTAFDYKQYAEQVIDDIKSRGKIPILVGGTGLYIESVLLDYTFRPQFEPEHRARLEQMATERLQNMIAEQGYAMPKNSTNRRHLIRTLETKGSFGNKQSEPRSDAKVFGIRPEREKFEESIWRRVDEMFEQGLLNETKQLLSAYDEQLLSNDVIGYKPCIEYISGAINMNEAKAELVKSHLSYAKRQLTLFKRLQFIQWSESSEKCIGVISDLLGKRNQTT